MNMAVIKIKNKQAIDELQAKLILRLGRKISQQETLDLCILNATNNFEDILQLASTIPKLSPEKAERIIKKFEAYADSYYNPEEKFDSSIDNDIYSL